jgi:hypothetical protein
MKKPAAQPPATPPAERNYFADVHEVVRLVPPGRVTSYGAIAHYLGAKRGSRAVGYALMASNLDAITHQKDAPTGWGSSRGATIFLPPLPCKSASKPKACAWKTTRWSSSRSCTGTRP